MPSRPTDHRPTVLVVDDDPAIRSALERALALEGFAVRTAGGGQEALEAVDEDQPQVLVLDVAMPDLDGVAVTSRLRAQGAEVPICMLSARDEIDDRVRGLEAGADDYVVKPFALDELIARLHALLRRADKPGLLPVQVADMAIDPARRTARRGRRELDLTRREFELLDAFMRHPGIVLTRDQLLSQVWGYDFAVDGNVVDVFVGYLRRKLETDGEPRVIQTVRGVGFVLRPSARLRDRRRGRRSLAHVHASAARRSRRAGPAGGGPRPAGAPDRAGPPLDDPSRGVRRRAHRAAGLAFRRACPPAAGRPARRGRAGEHHARPLDPPPGRRGGRGGGRARGVPERDAGAPGAVAERDRVRAGGHPSARGPRAAR